MMVAKTTPLDLVALEAAASAVPDPELPVVTIGELGIVRGVSVADDGAVEVCLTPTYVGCPATEAIAADVRAAVMARLRGDGGAVAADSWMTRGVVDSGVRASAAAAENSQGSLAASAGSSRDTSASSAAAAGSSQGASADPPGIEVRTRMVMSPPWSTDWISDSGRRKLAAHGIAPPAGGGVGGVRPGGAVFVQLSPSPSPRPPTQQKPKPEPKPQLQPQPKPQPCPHCGSPDTRELSAFGSTPCQSLRACRACGEPFGAMKSL